MKINRLQFLVIAALLVITILALGYIAELRQRNAELRVFIATELAATQGRLRETRAQLREIEARIEKTIAYLEGRAENP